MTLVLPPEADPALRDVVNQINERDALFVQAPTRLPIFDATADLPGADAWEGGLIFIRDIGSNTPMLAYSDGADWRRADTNATL